jgi:5-enolpyruvylshikimate-3-phosphate synthase
MTSEVNSDGLTIQGGQRPQRPDKPVETYGDHRVFMTAVLLAAACGGDVVGQSLHMVADEPFIDRLIASGVGVEPITMPPIED